MITISAFKWVPEFAHGQVRDLRARWALEEVGLPLSAPSMRRLEISRKQHEEVRCTSPQLQGVT
jgi:hypothetical protein